MQASEIDDTRVSARHENGVLELSLPKRAGGGAKQLGIS